MHERDYAIGKCIELLYPVRVRCCGVDPIPARAVVVLGKRTSPKRIEVGLYFPGDSDDYHHTIIPLEPYGIEEAKRTGRMFPNGGFCMHKVKLSRVRGVERGQVLPEIARRFGATPPESAA